MMQIEIDKFKGTIQLLHDYYHTIEDKLIPEAPESNTVDLMNPEGELPDVEKVGEGADSGDIASYSFPRLDDFFKKAIKAQVVPDVTQGAAADAGKKGGKKDPKAKGGADDSKVSPDSVYVTEMKESIKTEKAIFRFRICQIRNWALNRLKHQRELSLRIYQKLEDWIQVANKAENDAIEEVCEVIKDSIEGEKKIQVELNISFMDFVVDS
jgi:hypothetical protein